MALGIAKKKTFFAAPLTTRPEQECSMPPPEIIMVPGSTAGGGGGNPDPLCKTLCPPLNFRQLEAYHYQQVEEKGREVRKSNSKT